MPGKPSWMGPVGILGVAFKILRSSNLLMVDDVPATTWFEYGLGLK